MNNEVVGHYMEHKLPFNPNIFVGRYYGMEQTNQWVYFLYDQYPTFILTLSKTPSATFLAFSAPMARASSSSFKLFI